MEAWCKRNTPGNKCSPLPTQNQDGKLKSQQNEITAGPVQLQISTPQSKKGISDQQICLQNPVQTFLDQALWQLPLMDSCTETLLLWEFSFVSIKLCSLFALNQPYFQLILHFACTSHSSWVTRCEPQQLELQIPVTVWMCEAHCISMLSCLLPLRHDFLIVPFPPFPPPCNWMVRYSRPGAKSN